jgi:uncharacterized lipoprotein
MSVSKKILWLALIGLVVGCSWTDRFERSTAYKNSEASASSDLVLPETLKGSSRENYYPIPEIRSNAPSHEVSLIPPGSKIK